MGQPSPSHYFRPRQLALRVLKRLLEVLSPGVPASLTGIASWLPKHAVVEVSDVPAVLLGPDIVSDFLILAEDSVVLNQIVVCGSTVGPH